MPGWTFKQPVWWAILYIKLAQASKFGASFEQLLRQTFSCDLNKRFFSTFFFLPWSNYVESALKSLSKPSNYLSFPDSLQKSRGEQKKKGKLESTCKSTRTDLSREHDKWSRCNSKFFAKKPAKVHPLWQLPLGCQRLLPSSSSLNLLLSPLVELNSAQWRLRLFLCHCLIDCASCVELPWRL